MSNFTYNCVTKKNHDLLYIKYLKQNSQEQKRLSNNFNTRLLTR